MPRPDRRRRPAGNRRPWPARARAQSPVDGSVRICIMSRRNRRTAPGSTRGACSSGSGADRARRKTPCRPPPRTSTRTEWSAPIRASAWRSAASICSDSALYCSGRFSVRCKTPPSWRHRSSGSDSGTMVCALTGNCSYACQNLTWRAAGSAQARRTRDRAFPGHPRHSCASTRTWLDHAARQRTEVVTALQGTDDAPFAELTRHLASAGR
jgi:hypothetical protein